MTWLGHEFVVGRCDLISDPLMVVECSAFGHSDLISITRYYPINGAIIYKGHGESLPPRLPRHRSPPAASSGCAPSISVSNYAPFAMWAGTLISMRASMRENSGNAPDLLLDIYADRFASGSDVADSSFLKGRAPLTPLHGGSGRTPSRICLSSKSSVFANNTSL